MIEIMENTVVYMLYGPSVIAAISFSVAAQGFVQMTAHQAIEICKISLLDFNCISKVLRLKVIGNNWQFLVAIAPAVVCT